MKQLFSIVYLLFFRQKRKNFNKIRELVLHCDAIYEYIYIYMLLDLKRYIFMLLILMQKNHASTKQEDHCLVEETKINIINARRNDNSSIRGNWMS